ncbi:MAG: Omp28-related outer membrane protein [Bacteroidia bacterium]
MRFSAFFLCILFITLASCDKITNPIIATTQYSTLPTTPPDHVTQTTDSTLIKVLLEDYMGHFCTNCPAAVTIADGILQANPIQVVSMEVNVGYEALPAGASGAPLVPPGLPDTAYKNNYIIPAGTAWDGALTNTSNLGWPQGMVNRIYYTNPPGSGSPDISPSNWANVVDSILGTSQLASITMVDSCWIKQQIFGTQVKVELLTPPTPGNAYYLQMALVEDSVLDWQTDNGTPVQYFPHRFVLRAVINGTWGDPINLSSPVTKYYTFTSPNFRYASGTIKTPPVVPARLWNMAKCYVIAFLYQITPGSSHGDYYVLQSQILHI